MKYGMNMLLWTADVTEKHYPLLDKLKEMGYDGVELPVFELDLENFKQVGHKLTELGLGATAVTIATADANPISPDSAIRHAGLQRLRQAIDCSAAAGAKLLCGPFHSALGVFVDRGRTEDEWKWGQDVLARAASYAERQGVVLALEALNRFECYFLNCVEDAAQFCREIGFPNLKMMYDTFHAHIEQKGVAEAIRACADQLAHVHMSESDRATPGRGQVRWRTTAATLEEVGYKGWLVIEAFGLALPELAAATRIWRRMYETEDKLARDGLQHIRNLCERK